MTTSPAMTITNELLAELDNTLTDHLELNTSNYGHDDVCQLNSWAIGACEALERANLHIRSLTEQVEKDAARYRWLRKRAGVLNDGYSTLWLPSSRSQIDASDEAETDSAIDAAIAQEGADHE